MLHRSLRGSLRALTPLARAEHALPTSCLPQPAPPCPPCAPRPRPPCRAAPPGRARALRVACCPPPAGSRPPCAASPPTCALTCANFAAQQPSASSATLATQMTGSVGTEDAATCGAERDSVARRLAAAECVRRASYLREVAERPSGRQRGAPPAPYRLDTERECACATDGRVYAIAGPAGGGGTSGAASCGPDRVPAPPRCVELVPDNECQVGTGDGIDPCAHQPRIFMEIDRSNQKADKANTFAANNKANSLGAEHKAHALAADKAACIAQSRNTKCPSAQHSNAPPTAGLASRIMNSLSLGRGTTSASTPPAKPGPEGSGGASCPRRACGVHCKLPPGAARRAGDRGWCASPPAPAPAPPRCRPPSLAERLQRRTRPCSSSRRLHTGVLFFAKSVEGPIRNVKEIVAETKANAKKLSSILQEREGLAEAGRGRVNSGGGGGAARPAGGNLDMPVPAGAARLRVRVEMDGGSTCTPRCPAPAASFGSAASQPSHNLCAGVAKSSSWLSIDALRRKVLRPKSECTLKAKGTSPCRPDKSSSSSPSPCKRSSGANARPCRPTTSGREKDKEGGSGGKKKPCSLGSKGGPLGEDSGGRCAAPCRPPPCATPPPRAPCDLPPARCAAPVDALARIIFVHI